MKYPLYGAVAFLILFFVALFLRREGVIADPLALVLVPVFVAGFAGCTIWAGLRSSRLSRSRR